MHDDTPTPPPSDSHDPLIPERNEERPDDVAQGMDSPEIPNADMNEPPDFSRDSEVEVSHTDDGPYAEPVEPHPMVPFVYDDPFALETPLPHNDPPAPVSERIEAEPKRARSNAVPFLLGAAVAGVLGALITVGMFAATGTFDTVTTASTSTTVVTGEQATQPAEIAPVQIINDLNSAINPTAVAVKALPSVVTIEVYAAPVDDESPAVGIGSGSGVVIAADGYIVTNHHVIEDADTFYVTFEDGREYQATLVGSDPLTDIAVLKISATALVPVEFGSSDSLRIGDPVIAIGNPLGQEGGSSVSVGIISAFNRRVDFSDSSSLQGMIQTDAAINSGSSGGALLDVDGNLIGITSAIGVSQAGPEGIGYAIPIELVARISSEIIETGDVIHPFLGVSIVTFQTELADGAIAPGGAHIVEIEGDDSAAEIAGLQVGDVVISIGGRTILTQPDLSLAVRLYRVGDDVVFVAIRDGEEISFTIVMGQRPEEHGG